MVNAPTKISAANYKSLNIRMRVNKGSMAEVFWATDENQLSEATKISFRVIPDGTFHFMNFIYTSFGEERFNSK